MRRALALVGLLLAAAPAAASASQHVLTGTDANGHPAKIVVDSHLHPTFAHLRFTPSCASRDVYTLDLPRLDLQLVDQRLEDGALHKHWLGQHLNPQDGRPFGPMAVHVSRHPDGSIHAQGGASFEHSAHISGSHFRLCLFGVRFVVKEAHG